MTHPPTSLDHLILFLPASPSHTPLIPPSISKNFTLIPGGTHADGLTSNTLILLADSCYIELICFLPEASNDAIASHWWGPDRTRTDWTDWCLTTFGSAGENFTRLQQNAELDHPQSKLGQYALPIHGGRKRPDGTDVKWAVTFPAGENGGQAVRGKIPFFCHDVTARDLRVPVSEERTRHPCGATGVRRIEIVVRKEEMEGLVGVYEGVLGVRAEREEKGDDVVIFRVGRVVDGEAGARVVLRGARSEEEMRRVGERGFCIGEVVLGVGDGAEFIFL